MKTPGAEAVVADETRAGETREETQGEIPGGIRDETRGGTRGGGGIRGIRGGIPDATPGAGGGAPRVAIRDLDRDHHGLGGRTVVMSAGKRKVNTTVALRLQL